MMDNRFPENAAAQLTPVEAQKLFQQVFGDQAGQKALLYILVKIGGLAELRHRADAQARLIMDGKREAALEIMNLAGFSPFHLADRLMTIPQITATSRTMDHENLSATPPVPPAAKTPGRSRRRAASAPSSGAASAAEPAEFGGDAPGPASAAASASAAKSTGSADPGLLE